MSSTEILEPEVPGESPAVQMLWLASSYAEAAKVLCDALAEDEFTQQFTSSRVILYLCQHSTELFLKGAIGVITNQEPPSGHRLDKLYAQYRSLYPTDAYDFEVPFEQEIMTPDGGLFPETLKEVRHNHDQRFRYPTDVNGKPFVERVCFDIAEYQETVQAFWQQLNKLVAFIAFGWKL